MPLQVLRTNYAGRGKYHVIANGLNAIGRVLNNLKGLEPVDVTAAGEEIRIGLNQGNSSGRIAPFTVRKSGQTQIRVYGGTVQIARWSEGSGSPPPIRPETTIVHPTGGDWPDPADSPSASVLLDITEETEVWLKCAGTLTTELLTGTTPTPEEGVYWFKLATVEWADLVEGDPEADPPVPDVPAHITTVRQHLVGGIAFADYGTPLLCKDAFTE
jgi:hypothetical protein